MVSMELLCENIPVVGITFHGRLENLKQATINSDIRLEREPENIYDKNAIKVIVDGHQVGYISRSLAAYLSKYDNLFADIRWVGDGELLGMKIDVYGQAEKKTLLGNIMPIDKTLGIDDKDDHWGNLFI